MSDNEIRQILIHQRKKERIKDAVEGIVAWTCWAALGFMMFCGAYMIG